MRTNGDDVAETTSRPTRGAGEAGGPCRLALASGAVFTGRAFGARGRRLVSVAEVVFNTAMSGYQESLTDPSYAGQILVQTAPLVGNTGVNSEDVESSRVRVSGLVVHEYTRRWSNYRGEASLGAYLDRAGVLGISGLDTRALTRVLRSSGVMMGTLTDREDLGDEELIRLAREAPSMEGADLVKEVGGELAGRVFDEDLGAWVLRGVRLAADDASGSRPPRIVALDCGAKLNILRHLRERGCEVIVVAASTPAAAIAEMVERGGAAGGADGVFISNGPGDPAAVRETVAALREILTRGTGDPDGGPPVFGICLGHQLLSLAVGAKTYKLPFGHRGANQPVRDVRATAGAQGGPGRVHITSQNHGFAVDAESLEGCGGEVTHVHLNDGTVAGFRLKDRPVFAVQFHPEASPGPHDAAGLFDEFVAAVRARMDGRTQ